MFVHVCFHVSVDQKLHKSIMFPCVTCISIYSSLSPPLVILRLVPRVYCCSSQQICAKDKVCHV